MGKQKRTRTKYHISKQGPTEEVHSESIASQNENKILLVPEENLFSGLNIDVNNITNKLSEDAESSISNKVKKREFNKHTSKKEKLKAKKEMLLRKIDTVNQLKKENKLRNKRKKNVIVGDINTLFDALPNIDKEVSIKRNSNQTKKRGIEKAKKRKKDLQQNLSIFKRLVKTRSNPFTNV